MKQILLLGAFITSVLTSAQNCEEIIKENDYLKQVINLNKPQYEIEFDRTEISIIKVEGNIKQETVSITILLNNKDVNKYTAITGFSGTDLEGNQYTKQNFAETKGLNSTGSATLITEVPIKIETILVKVPALTPYLKLLKFDYYSEILKKHESILLKDLKIIWK